MITHMSNKLDILIKRADDLLGLYARLSDVSEPQQNIMNAGINKTSKKSDKEIMETMLDFTKGDTKGGYAPPPIALMSDNPQSNIKQAGLNKEVDAEEKQRTFLEFSGLV